MRLTLLHRAPGAAPPPADAATWRTCLREIHFLTEPRVRTADATLIADADAYALLLEIVCGLRSPLIGETEVQSQFKAFLATIDPRTHGWLHSIGQRILADAKHIRHAHFQGFGAHSYGRLAAAHLRGSRLGVIGAGALAADVLQHAGPGRRLDVWSRRADHTLPGTLPAFTLRLLDDAASLPDFTETATLIVAAPVAAEALRLVHSRYVALQLVVDLRGSDQRTTLSRSTPVITLEDLFAAVPDSASAAAHRVADARADILKRAQAFAGREQLRPFGWDDVCA